MSEQASTRRARFATLTAVLLTAATAAAVVLVSIASRHHVRFDVTSTREHALSARTKEILRTMQGEHRVVVSVDTTRLDPRSRQRIGDLLDEFQEESDLIEIVEIDTSMPQSLPAFASLIEELAANESAEIERQSLTLEFAADDAEALAEEIRAFEPQLDRVRDAYEQTDSRYSELNRLSAYLGESATALVEAATEVRRLARNELTGVLIPDAPASSERLVPALYHAATLLETAARASEVLLRSESRDEVLGDLRTIIRAAEPMRDEALLSAESIASLRALRVLDIARALRSNDAVLVINPRRTTAIDFRSLFPPTTLVDSTSASGAEITFAGEELIASAIASINNPRNPVLVFTHGETGRVFDDAGKPSTLARQSFGNLLSRLRLRGFELREWHTATEELPPSPAELDPTLEKPVVYFVFGPPTVSGGADSAGMAQADRALRLGALTKAVETLFANGESVMLSLGLSDLAALGESDPIASQLESLGVRARTDLMMLRLVEGAAGQRSAFSEFRIPRTASDHPIAEAIDGLLVALPSPIPLELVGADGVETWPLLSIDDTPEIYGESEWSRLPYPVSPQPLRVNVLPTISVSRDAASPPNGAWVVAAAVSEPSSGRRAVIVGSHVWFADLISQRQAAVEGRNIWVNPGNLELLESGIYWLAGLDEMIAPSPHTLDIPRIKTLDDTQLALIRWLLIAIVPAAPLVIGAAWRLLRP